MRIAHGKTLHIRMWSHGMFDMRKSRISILYPEFAIILMIDLAHLTLRFILTSFCNSGNSGLIEVQLVFNAENQ